MAAHNKGIEPTFSELLKNRNTAVSLENYRHATGRFEYQGGNFRRNNYLTRAKPTHNHNRKSIPRLFAHRTGTLQDTKGHPGVIGERRIGHHSDSVLVRYMTSCALTYRSLSPSHNVHRNSHHLTRHFHFESGDALLSRKGSRFLEGGSISMGCINLCSEVLHMTVSKSVIRNAIW